MGEKNVEVITEVDFLTRCYQIGIKPHLTGRQVLCTLKALNSLKSKNAIKVYEISTALNRFMKKNLDKDRVCAEFLKQNGSLIENIDINQLEEKAFWQLVRSNNSD